MGTVVVTPTHEKQSACKKPKPCGCPICLGLACLERPRFFAGQLLTEEELNGEQAYQVAKNRLHNRYLHGPGVVCGLEVTCSDCKGHVNISPGYAIDPCGNDIIVCEPASFDLIAAIAKCCENRSRKRDDCDPYQPPPARGCEEAEQTWCVAVEYLEQQARPVTPLRPSKSRSCGCANGSNGHRAANCGCGKPPDQCSCASQPASTQATPQTAANCEPTRIRETHCLSVLEEPESCRNLLKAWRDPYTGLDRSSTKNPLLKFLRLVPDDSLLGQIIACWKCAFEILASTVKNQDWEILFLAAEQKLANTQMTPQQLHAAACRLRQAVVDLYGAAPYTVRCEMMKVLADLDCAPPEQQETMQEYQARMAVPIRNLFTMIAQYLLDCVCEAFLPPCSSDPLDNRVILACVTVKNGKILRICNFGCRSYAGSFPSLYYWLSAIPIASWIGYALELLCCAPDLVHKETKKNLLYQYADRVDPRADKRTAFVGNDFSGARMMMNKAGEFINKATFKRFRDMFAPGFEGTIALNDNLGKEKPAVEETLAGAKVAMHFREIRSDAEMSATASPRVTVAREGDQVLAYVKDGKVVGFTSYTAEDRLREKEAEIDRTLAEMKALRDELRKR